jgi:hypothetical protein
MSDRPQHEIPHLHIRPPRLVAPRAHADAEIDGRVYGLMVFRATRPEQMGEAREPDPPDYSMLT